MHPDPDPRSLEILGKIKTVFGQKGFERASMQDLARAAGMSAGNFYRYFASKDAIIEAMVGLDLREVSGHFEHILSSRNPRGTFIEVMRHELLRHREECDGPLWAEIEAAAARRPEIAAILAQMEREIGRHLIETFALMNGRPVAEVATRFGSHAELILILFKGVAMQPQVAPALIDLAMTTIDHLLDDVVSRQPALPAAAVRSA
jgi:AcrR family transcriptional regulator